MPGGKRVKSYSSASAQCTVRCGGGSSAASPEARSRSSSMTSKCPTNFSKCLVSAPSPGPISTMKSVFDGLMACTRRASTPGSCRKCWPKRLRGRCERDRKLGRLDQAARVGLAGSGELERGAVVDRGTHERQAEGHVHAASEARVFEHREALVMVHGEHAIGGAQPLRHEQRVSRNRAARRDARVRSGGNGGRDDLEGLASEMPRLAAVRIEPGDENARPRDAEKPPPMRVEDAERPEQIFRRDRA